MKSEVIFCFDTEDFTSNYASNAIRDLANILRAEGVRGCFCIVGLVAEQLHKWGRGDVLEALSHHEIDYHSYAHSLHPLINEYTDLESFQEAYDEFFRRESVGLEMLKNRLGVEKIYAAVPPGNSKSYVAMYAYSDMGIPVYADTVLDSPDGGLYFCNALHLQYMSSLEGIFYNNRRTIDELIECFAGRRRSIIYTHPNRVLYKDFWDELNYKKENLREFDNWLEGEQEPFSNVEHYYRGLRELIRRLKNDGRFCFKTIAEVVEEEQAKPERRVRSEELGGILNSLRENMFPVSKPCPLSMSDIFAAAVSFLRGADEFLPAKAYGFLDEPQGVTKETKISKKDLEDAAKGIDLNTFLPYKIKAGKQYIGPYDFLIAALEILSEGKDETIILPKAQQLNLDAFPDIRDVNFKGTWLHSDLFEDNYLSKRLKLQSWTIRKI